MLYGGCFEFLVQVRLGPSVLCRIDPNAVVQRALTLLLKPPGNGLSSGYGCWLLYPLCFGTALALEVLGQWHV